MESLFYVIYLIYIIFMGIFIIKKKNNNIFIFLGLALIILGFGDAFHLIPRAVGLFTNTLDKPSDTLDMFLGVGKLITSITMTVFYLLLYLFIKEKMNLKYKILDIAIYIFVTVRLVLCILPQNNWILNNTPLYFGIIRNIPFVILGLIIIVLSFIYFKNIKHFKLLWLFILLSFIFYIPVVILASKYTWVGLLMLPKTICYMIIAYLFYLDVKNLKNSDIINS